MVVEFAIGKYKAELEKQYEELRWMGKQSQEPAVGDVLITLKWAVEAKLNDLRD